MQSLKPVLIIFTIVVFGITITAVATTDAGFVWPIVFFGDLLELNWRAQFNGDFLMHLLLLAVWVWWREGGGVKGWVIGFICVSWGGMFTFPYFLYLIVQSKADVRKFLLGVRTPATAAQ